jgi:hypothetical protein
MGTIREQAVDGCLMTYGASLTGNYRRGATYIANILKGMKPANLPMEQPTSWSSTSRPQRRPCDSRGAAS